MNLTTQAWIVFALLAFVLVRNLRGFVLFLAPGRVRYEALGEDVSTTDPALRTMFRELEELGFSPLGRVLESRPLSPKVEQSVFRSGDGRDMAMVFPRQREAWLSFVSTPADAVVWTADHVFPTQELGGFVTGGLPGASPQELLAAHRRRAARLEKAGSDAVAQASGGEVALAEGEGVGEGESAGALAAYIDAAKRLQRRGPPKGELRRRSTRGFLFATAALAWAAMTAWKVFFTI